MMLIKTTVNMIKAGGVPDSTTFLRSDHNWATVDGVVSTAPTSSLTKVDLNMIEIPGNVSTTSFLRGDGTWTDINTLNGSAPIWGTTQGGIAIANEQSAFTTNLVAVDPNGLTLTYAITSGALPTGLTLNTTTGVISGTTPQVYTNTVSNFTISVSNGTTATPRDFFITVNNSTNEPPVWSTTAGSLGSVGINTTFNYTLTATDPNNNVITYTLVSGSLPAGLSLSTAGLITGTTTAIGSTTTSSFTVSANDGMGGTLDRAFSITVNVTLPTKVVFSYTGADQTWVVPAGVTNVSVKLWGAGGATGNPSQYQSGGGGGFTTGMLAVTPGQILTIIVGGGGRSGTIINAYGGGGAPNNPNGGGGGRTAIRLNGVELATAGGGGGVGNGMAPPNGTGGAGGGTDGTAGTAGRYNGQGGSQTSGGAAGYLGTNGAAYQGGNGGWGNSGGGGGGYYGGGGAGDDGNGGGGSGYTGVLISASTITGSGAIPAGNSDTDYITNIGTGGVSGSGDGGNGRVVISYNPANLTVAATSGNKDAMNVLTISGTQYGSDVTFTVSNTGQSASSTINYALTNTTNFEFHGGTLTSGSSTIAGGSSGTIIVRPKANSTGTYSGSLNITANNNPSISMSGTASAAPVVYSTQSLWEGNVASYIFSGANIQSNGSNIAIRTITPLTGNFIVQATMSNQQHCFGIYDVSEDATFDQNAQAAGVNHMTTSFFWFMGNGWVQKGSTILTTITASAGSLITITRNNGVITYNIGGTTYTYSGTYNGNMRIVFGSGNTVPLLTNVNWVQY